MDKEHYLPLLRGRASDNDAVLEARAESACTMGVGCGLYGICYAERMGRPEMCGRENNQQTEGFKP